MMTAVRQRARTFAARPDAVPLLIAGVMFLLGVQVALISTVPSWANDEPAHVGYVASLAQGHLPTIETDIVDDPARFPLTAEEFAGRDEEHGDIWTANHPPLFHIAMVPLWSLLHEVNQSGMVIAMRIANTLGFAVWLYLVGALARHLVPGRPAVANLAVVVAATPTLVLRSGYLQNDGWAGASAALLLLATLRLLREETTDRRIAVAALAGTLAAGIRAQGALLVALCAITLLVVLATRDRARGAGLGRALRVAVPVGGVPALAWGWFYVRNYRLYGDFTGQDALLEKFDRATVPFSALLSIRTLDQPLMATALVIAAALMLVPLAIWDSVRRLGFRWDAVWTLLVVHAGLTLVSLIGFLTDGGGFHDRYVMQVMPLLCTATAIGMVGVSRWLVPVRVGSATAQRRDAWIATVWAGVLLVWLAGATAWLQWIHVYSRQAFSPVNGPVPDLLALAAAALGVAAFGVMLDRARRSSRAETGALVVRGLEPPEWTSALPREERSVGESRAG